MADVKIDRRISKAHLGNSVANFKIDSEAALELGNQVHDAESYFSDYSLVVKDEQTACN